MNKALAKSITIVIALILALTAVGSAFAVYSVNATPVVVNISAALPAVDECHVLGSWNSWTAANDNKMTYSAGTYTYNDKSIVGGNKFKVYNATQDSWNDTVAACTPPYTKDGDNNIVLTKSGTYDISYVIGTGITVTADSYDYTVTGIPSWYTSDGALIFIYAYYDDGSTHDTWVKPTTSLSSSYTATFTLPAAYTTIIVVRCDSTTTEANVDWSHKFHNQSTDLDVSGTSTVSYE